MLQLDDIHKAFDGKAVLRGVTIEAPSQQIVCLLGASGSGKSTLLRITAGLETLDRGRARWDGADLAGVPVHERGFGLMFQDFALFPHRDVGENVAFGLRMQRLAAGEAGARSREALDRVGLAGYERRTIEHLSGGEKQRVALARSIAPRPRLLMLDEPLGSLDRILREQLSDELRNVIKSLGLTAVYVTHDQAEAFNVADQIVLLRDGAIEQAGPPEVLYQQPASEYVAHFMGLHNVLDGTVDSGDAARALVRSAHGVFVASVPARLDPGAQVKLVVRPEAAQPGLEFNVIEGRVLSRVFRGAAHRARIELVPGVELSLDLDATPTVGEHVRVGLRPEALSVIVPARPAAA